MTCPNCKQASDAPMSDVTLNVRGLGRWSWTLCSGCAQAVSHAVLQAVRQRAMLAGDPDPSDLPPSGAIVGAVDDTPIVTCEQCGRVTVDGSNRCSSHQAG